MAQNQSDDAARLLNQLSRYQMQQILENHGYAVYDSEATDDLLETIRQDVESGEVDIAEIELHLEGGSTAPSR